jgi:hypothetical protein
MVELQRPTSMMPMGRFALVGDIALVSYCPLPASYTVLIQTVLRQVLAGP